MRIIIYIVFFGILIIATFLVDLMTGGSKIFVQKKEVMAIPADDSGGGGGGGNYIKVESSGSSNVVSSGSSYGGNNYGRNSYGGDSYGKDNYGDNSYGQDNYGSSYGSRYASTAASSENVSQGDSSVDLEDELFGKNTDKIQEKKLDDSELDGMETVFEGKSYEVYLFDGEDIKLAHKVWFDFVKPPSKVLKGNYYRDTWANDGCCLWVRKGHYEIVYDSNLFKKLGKQKFKK